MLGYSVSYFLGKEWRNTPLYAQKIIPVLDYLLSNNFTYNDKLSGAFYELINKYQNPSDLPTESLKELAREMGYDYILNLLADDEEVIKILIYLLVLIHQLKGSRQGLELVMSLFAYGEGRKNILISDWFKQIPTTQVKADVIHWYKTRPMDEDGIDNWLYSIRTEEENLTYQEWIARIPIGGTNDEVYTWYLNIPDTSENYQDFISWISQIVFEEDVKIEEWFEDRFVKDNEGNIIGIKPLGEENTFSLETKVDVRKINAEFFNNFDTFIHSYVYPELTRLKISTAVKSEMTYIPYTRVIENFRAVGQVTGYEDYHNDNKVIELNTELTSVGGQCVWTITNPFNDKNIFVNILNVNTGEQQLCNIVQTDTIITVYIDSDNNIQANTFVAILLNDDGEI